MVVCAAPLASADLLEITDGTSTFSNDPDTETANFTGPNTGDLMFGESWMLRYTDPSESNSVQTRRLQNTGTPGTPGAYVTQTATSSGATGSIDVEVGYTQFLPGTPPPISLFSVEFDYAITTWGGNPVRTYSVTLTNMTDATQTGSLFQYADYDVLGFANDSGNLDTFGAYQGLTQFDGTTSVFHGFDSYDDFEVRAWASGGNIDDDLLADSNYTLSNGGVPFELGDMTMAFSWDFSLAAGESMTINGFAGVPEPGTMFMTGLAGLAFGGVVLRRRLKAKQAS